MTKPAASRTRRPTRGRAAAVDDIIEAAARLFAQKSPTGVSLREVADAADVNVGLIHHYIGNKEDLITAVLGRAPISDFEDLTDGELVDGMAQFLVAGEHDDPQTIQLIGNIRAALAGIDLAAEGVRFPLAKTLYKRAAQRTDPTDAQVRAVFILSAVAGWRLLGRPALAAISPPTPTDELVIPTLVALFRQALLPSAAGDSSTAEDVLPGDKKLTERQLEIVERLLRGERVPAIARSLRLSPSTVRNRLSTVFRTFGVHSQQELLVALRGSD